MCNTIHGIKTAIKRPFSERGVRKNGIIQGAVI